MFSPNQNTSSGPAMATRSRRRQRPVSSDNSLTQQPKAKRQRRPLTESALVNPDTHNAQPEMLEVKHDKVAKLPSVPDGIENAQAPTTRPLRREVTVRPKKPKQGERTSKSDGSVELARTNTYTVSKLQALPDRIRAEPAGRQHGALYASNGYGLCLTHTHALVWSYASTTPSPETFVFTLPYPSKHASDPLPLGSLVPSGTSKDEPGLLVVMPVSGKISFWEHISAAATLDFLQQQRNGVEDTISGMFGGEHVVQITRADSAGFILSLSSGRLAHLSVRDGQGKPAISVQFLRATSGQNSGVWGGVFGSIRTALKSAVQRGDVAAVRVQPSNRAGPKTIVAATKTGRIHSWRVQRGGHHEIIANIDARGHILENLQSVLPPINHNVEFEVLDFTFVPRGIDGKYINASRLSQALSEDDDSLQHLLLLVSLSNKRQSRYALVELVLQGDEFDVGMVRTISAYTTPVNPSATERPRLYLPRPGLVAFIIFDRAVVVASIAAPPETPDSQLQEENHVIPATFEDVIDLRDQESLEIVGSGLEEPLGPGQEPEGSRSHRLKFKNPSALLMIRGVGVVRVALSDIDKFATEKPPEVTAKNKLEQAVFFGLKDENPLVFEGRRELPFSDAEIGEAALQLSQDIMASNNPVLPALPASVEVNTRQRSIYLDRLMSHLNAQNVTLDRRTKWQLLANAEKMNMAREIWKLHETFLGERPGNDKKTVVSEVIECIAEEEKKNLDRNIGQLDRARTWFTHDTGRLEIFVPWTYQMIKYYHKEHLADDPAMTRFLFEGVLVSYEALHGALEYRKRNLKFYGLGSEKLQHGVLAHHNDYLGLPEFWTSTGFICNNLFRLVQLCQMWLDAHYPSQSGSGTPDASLIESIRNMMPSLTDQLILTLTEFVSWSEANGTNVGNTSFSEKCKDVLADSTELILKLKDYGLWDDALQIAEKYTSDRALAELIVAQIKELRSQGKARGVDSRAAADLKVKLDGKKRLFTQYMDQYGASFAFESYRLLLAYGGIQMVLEFAANDKKGYATMFLRNDDRLGKISWINDIEREHDLNSAAKTLIDVGQAEDQVWNKKIELSLGKLTLLAEGAGADAEVDLAEDRSKAAKCDNQLAQVEKDLEIVHVQDQIYQIILPAFQDAVDDVAAVELAMQTFSPKIPKKHKVLSDDLQEAFHQLVTHKALKPLTLINLLTLIRLDEVGAVECDPFFQALRVADLGLQGKQRQDARRLIWRRCYIRDEWSKVNYTENMTDRAVVDILGRTQAYCTMFACIQHHIKQHDKETPYILTPAEALGVYTDPDVEILGWEDDDPTLQEKRAEAMRWEDASLKKFVDKNQLVRWAGAAYEVADREVRIELDVATANGANGSALMKVNGQANGHVVESVEGVEEDDGIE
ncbi:hypothetical protein VP1G_03982 [Cytospora mali]|uniref:Nucleoporin NUP133 n=1 Tax=Cytospora mali TaxID=578113 RepID=A0A194UYN3_CYTMA|nr:hypothetical protein VP1G_03982 [Valsa mali var. pyri (nom. inval.)]